MCHLAHDEQLQQRLRRQVTDCLGGTQNLELLLEQNKVPLLLPCLHESIRKYSLIQLNRIAMRDLEFEGKVIPKGSYISISPITEHHDPAVFPNPDLFNPDRFVDPAEFERLERSKLFNEFGYNRHKCIGHIFIKQQFSFAVGALLSRFQLKLASPMYEPDFFKGNGAAGPTQEILLTFTEI